MSTNEEIIRNLHVLGRMLNLDEHNMRVDALSWLVDDRIAKGEEVSRLTNELTHKQLELEALQRKHDAQQQTLFDARLNEDAQRDAAHELLKRLDAHTWQTGDLALPRHVKDYFVRWPR